MATLAGTVDLRQTVRPGRRNEAVSVDHQRPDIPVAQSTDPSRTVSNHYGLAQGAGKIYRLPGPSLPAAPKDVAGIFLRFLGAAAPSDVGVTPSGLVWVSESEPRDGSTSPASVCFNSRSAPFHSGRWDRTDSPSPRSGGETRSPAPTCRLSFTWLAKSSLGAQRAACLVSSSIRCAPFSSGDAMTELRGAVDRPLDAVFTISPWTWAACIGGCLAFWMVVL